MIMDRSEKSLDFCRGTTGRRHGCRGPIEPKELRCTLEAATDATLTGTGRR